MKLKLTESQYLNLLSYINEARQAPVPINLSGLFNKNKNTAFFTIVKLTQKTKDESEYLFNYQKVNGGDVITDANKGTVTKGCTTHVNLDTMVYDDEFNVLFGDCNKNLVINNVVGIRLFDENHTKLDELKFDNTSSADSENLVNLYNDNLKGSSIGDELYFTTPKKELDGEVLNKSSDKLEVEIHEKGKNINKLLYINMDSDGFYEENGNLFFKATEKNVKNGTESEFNIPIKKFSTSRKSEVKKPEVNDPKPEPGNPEPGNTEPSGDNPKGKGWRTPEEEEALKAKAKAAYDAILNDPELQKAFYRKPSFWNLFTAELKGEKAPVDGIVPTLQLVGDYKAKQVDVRLKGDFIEGQQVTFEPYEKDIVIYNQKDETEEIYRLQANRPNQAKVRPFDIEDNVRYLENNAYNNGYIIELLEPTEVENVYKCNVSHSRSRNHAPIDGVAKDVYIKLDPRSKGYKPMKLGDGNQENKEQQTQEPQQ